MKEYAEARGNIRRSDINIGDKVLLKNVTQQGKLIPKFQQQPFEVIQRKGAMVTAQLGQETKARNVTHFRKISTDTTPLPYPPDEPDPVPLTTTDVHPLHPASRRGPVGSPSTSGVEMPNLPCPISRPQRLRSVAKRLEYFEVTLPCFTE